MMHIECSRPWIFFFSEIRLFLVLVISLHMLMMISSITFFGLKAFEIYGELNSLKHASQFKLGLLSGAQNLNENTRNVITKKIS